jgi:hypothetical protein
VVGVRGLPGLYVKLAKVPGGFAVRPICGGKTFAVIARRIEHPSEAALLARYSGINDSARSMAIAKTIVRRQEKSLVDRSKWKADKLRNHGY